MQTNGDQLSVIFNNNIVKYDYVPAKWYDYQDGKTCYLVNLINPFKGL